MQKFQYNILLWGAWRSSDGRHCYTNKLRVAGVQQWSTRLSVTNNEHIYNNVIIAYNADFCTIEINQIKCCSLDYRYTNCCKVINYYLYCLNYVFISSSNVCMAISSTRPFKTCDHLQWQEWNKILNTGHNIMTYIHITVSAANIKSYRDSPPFHDMS